MKKTALTFLAIAVFLGVQAQITFTHVPDTVYGTSDDWVLESHVVVYNNSNNALKIIVERTDVMTIGNDFYFCWGANCYSSSQMISTDTVALNPGDSTETFTAYMRPMGNTGIAKVNYKFKDINGLDSADFDIVYNISPGTTTGVTFGRVKELKVYPNPVSTSLNIEGELQTIEIYDVLGKKIYSCNPKSIFQVLDLSETPEGMYFMKVKNNNGKIFTEKLVIKH
ncbi:MAG: T9SS C-terminal target domain-containing protein [Bacteroidetes bacterium]|nr:MAG: T9SS C-terminal target domain-containing protein [Bacteroidota bacterium]